MQLNSLTFPIKVATWALSCGGQKIAAYYSQWNGSEPYAGGFGIISWEYNGNAGTNQMAIYWLGSGQFAVQATDTGIYAAVSTGAYASAWALTDGSTASDQAANTTITSNGTFTLVNIGDGKGNVAIQYGGSYMTVNYSNWIAAWGFWAPGPSASSIGPYETITVSGSQFPILLITASGLGLNLTGQDFSEGGYINSIAGVNFSRAVLANADLSQLPNLSVAGCNFTNASVSGTILTGVQHLNQATWTGANLSNTDLSQVDPGGTQGVQFVGTNLQGANLSHVPFTGADFTNASLTSANLDGADLTGANLTSANLTGASMAGTILTGANLTGTIFNGVDLSTTIFDPAPAFGTSAATATLFRNATVPATSLGPNWSYIDLTGATVTHIPQTLSGLIAEHTLFPTPVSFAGVTLQRANFTGAQLFYADFTGADLGFATLNGALLKGAKLTNANLGGATLTGAWLIAEGSGSDPNQYEAAVCANAFLLNTVLDECQAAGVDFSGSLFVTDLTLSSTPASAQGAFMVRAVFTDAVAVQVNFNGTQLSGGQFGNAILVGSTFASCTLDPTSGGTHSVPTMHNANICGTQFAQVSGGVTTNPANMDGLEMEGAQYSTASGLYNPTTYTDYYGKPVIIYVEYGATVLGTTTSGTTCPNGQVGPCTL
jgi:uncharacterized protein YjbI with pentapeptide repeats